MSKIVIARTTDMSHEEWLLARKKGIGGSDCAAVCAMNRWRGPLDVFIDKTSSSIEDTNNESSYWGNVLEPILLKEFSRRTGLKTEAVPFIFQFKEYPFMIANIDGIAHETDGSVSLLEIKTANGFAAKEWEDGLPPEYYLQIQHYLAVTDISKSYVAVLIGGNHFKYETIERDEETIRMLIAMESAFWNNHIVTNIPPEADATSGAILEKLYPKSDKTSVILPEIADDLVAQIADCKSVAEDLKNAQSEAENKLKSLMKDAEYAKTPAGYSISWKNTDTTRIDTAKLKAELPDVYTQFSKKVSTRRFSISNIKK